MRPAPPLLLLCVVLIAAPVVAAPASPQPVPVVVDGVGAAHGLGLAMDGVLGQARAGWGYRRILTTFYSGVTPGTAKGNLRVGLAEGSSHTLSLPGGGEVRSDTGTAVRLPAGATVSVRHDGAYIVDAPGIVRAAQAEELVPVPAPSTAPGPTPTPAPDDGQPSSPPPPPPAAGDALRSSRPVWIVPSGDPAVSTVGGRRYRGRIEVRYSDTTRTLWVINHVDLETYVQGIAEEKGAGWPVEGLKVLAVASRTLAAATMQWYTKHHANGFDICPTEACQVYLGLDGEEPAMTKATKATAGEIAVYAGRPILAMYHGNGGGETESYRLLYGDGRTDPYPYLRSVEYQYASPRPWQRVWSLNEVAGALAAKGIAAPRGLRTIEVVERGDSPRVRKVRLSGDSEEAELTGLQLQGALGLPSAWFDVRVGGDVPLEPAPPEPLEARIEVLGLRARPMPTAPADPRRRPDVLAAAVLLLALALSAASGTRRSPTRMPDG